MARVRVWFIAVWGLAAAACGFSPGITGSGNIKTETRTVSGFNAVNLAGTGRLTIAVTGTDSLEITADDNLLSYLTSDVSGKELTLGTKSHTSISPSKDPVYKLTVKDLSSITLGGSGAIVARDIHTDRLKVVLGGSGDISTSGTAGDQDILIGGSGAYHAPDLKSKIATITIGGSGDADLNAAEKLNVTIAGSGSVTYTGDPTVTQQILGSGTVKKK
jgi:hypothetical protein